MKQAWRVVGLLWIVAVLNYLDRQLVANMGGPIKAELHIGDGAFGLFSSMFLWIYALTSPVAGYVADRFGRRPVILFSLTAWSTATLWTGFAPSYRWMLTARAIMGISESFYMPAAVSMVVDYHRGRTRSLATGLHLSGVYAGSMLGGMGGWIAETLGWRTGFKMFGIIGVAYALILSLLLPESPPIEAEAQQPGPRTSPVAAIAALLGSGAFVLLLLANACDGAMWVVRNWTPVFLNTELGVSLTRAGLYGTAVYNAAAFVGMLLAATLADRLAVGKPRVRALIPAVGFCVAAPCLFSVGLFPAAALVLATVPVAGMSQGFLDTNLMPAMCTVTSPRYRASGYGLLNLVGTFAGGVMTYAAGLLKDAHVPFARSFQIAAVILLGAGVLLTMVKPTVKHESSCPSPATC
jgi:MFS family permease